ncbi:coiled-coil domain-containing protein [Mycoplasma marinum]|uniref:Uncharacterized protein n=1 Tax=Mycoplasma marinum TaxID=1937190 RepID=A0A4V6N9K9_9MOLU|nr:hypothetical protein [Mycoplasma marinum]TCG11894.1 hypothetical protein C4B24_00665 [Mycoplasma marinum]
MKLKKQQQLINSIISKIVASNNKIKDLNNKIKSLDSKHSTTQGELQRLNNEIKIINEKKEKEISDISKLIGKNVIDLKKMKIEDITKLISNKNDDIKNNNETLEKIKARNEEFFNNQPNTPRTKNNTQAIKIY